jgi:hypothetical protein
MPHAGTARAGELPGARLRSVPPAVVVDLGSEAVRHSRRFALGRPIAARAGHSCRPAHAAVRPLQGRPDAPRIPSPDRHNGCRRRSHQAQRQRQLPIAASMPFHKIMSPGRHVTHLHSTAPAQLSKATSSDPSRDQPSAGLKQKNADRVFVLAVQQIRHDVSKLVASKSASRHTRPSRPKSSTTR